MISISGIQYNSSSRNFASYVLFQIPKIVLSRNTLYIHIMVYLVALTIYNHFFLVTRVT